MPVSKTLPRQSFKGNINARTLSIRVGLRIAVNEFLHMGTMGEWVPTSAEVDAFQITEFSSARPRVICAPAVVEPGFDQRATYLTYRLKLQRHTPTMQKYSWATSC